MKKIPSGRREDARLLEGRARFVDDVHLDRMVEGVFIRSPIAHGRIVRIDSSAALAAGAHLVLTADDLPFGDRKFLLRQTNQHIRGGWAGFLARGVVRYVGEPVAFVAAADRYLAEDLAELIEIEYEHLAAIDSTQSALKAGAPLLHHAWPGNVAAEFVRATGDPVQAMAAAPRRLKRSFSFGRQVPLPLETRGCIAAFDHSDDSLTLWVSTQTHYQVRQNVAAMLDLPEHRVRVQAQDVGGGFGSKSRPYPEEIVVSQASRMLGRPVKWIEDRFEHLQSTTHSRAVDTTLEVGFDDCGKLLAVDASITTDIGAYVFTSGIITSEMAAAAMAGPYFIPHMQAAVRCIGTNKTPLATFRGAGQPEGTFPLEVMLDLVARELGMSCADVRRCNLLAPAQLPHPIWAPRHSVNQVDSGDFPALFEKAITSSGFTEKRQALHGPEVTAWGIACGLELTGSTSLESARISIEPDGQILLFSGMSSQGQGQATAYAAVCAEVLGVEPDRVVVRMGDTHLLPFGRGAFGSRGAVVGANAVHGAAERLARRAIDLAARWHGVVPQQLIFREGAVHDTSGDHPSVSLQQLAASVAPGGTLFDGCMRLEAEFVFDTRERHTYAMSVHAARVAVDLTSGFVRVLDYYVAHDCGRPLDAALVEGQVLGGVAEGIGCALLSELLYDEQSQPLAGTLADYLVATATEVPRIRIDHLETVAGTNPLGIRGIGEAGTIPAAPAIVNAIARAICETGINYQQSLLRLPVKPAAVLQAIAHQRDAASETPGVPADSCAISTFK